MVGPGLLEKRVAAEKAAHEADDVLAQSYRLKDRFSHIWSYPSLVRLNARFKSSLSDLSDKVVLDYGCGTGDASIEYIEQGATVCGIDIAQNFIDSCVDAAKAREIDANKYQFQVMDAHKLEFPDNYFDIVAGNGILHHLDTSVAMSEIYRVLKPGGRVLLKEPLAGNPLIKIFRFMTPSARTDDEMPLSKRTIQSILVANNWKSESYYCGLIEAPVAVVTSIVMPGRPVNVLLNFSDKVEQVLNRLSFLSSWNQYVLLSLIKRN